MFEFTNGTLNLNIVNYDNNIDTDNNNNYNNNNNNYFYSRL